MFESCTRNHSLTFKNNTMTPVTIIVALAALFLAWIGLIMKTENFLSGFIFKLVPLVLAFLLGLITFGVLK